MPANVSRASHFTELRHQQKRLFLATRPNMIHCLNRGSLQISLQNWDDTVCAVAATCIRNSGVLFNSQEVVVVNRE